MICLVGLGAFSTYILLSPAHSIALVLDLMYLATSFRFELLGIAVINILACFAFERYAERPIARLIKNIKRSLRRRREKERKYQGDQYKVIESNMR